MKEDHLHQFWKRISIDTPDLKCVNGRCLKIIDPGIHNQNSGPDFLNACLEIDGIRWHGNIEIHLRSSDWLRHGHEEDPAYQDILLNVVYENDVELSLNCSTLELKSDKKLRPILERCIDADENIFQQENKKKSPVEDRTQVLENYLFQTKNNWEESWYRLLCRSMGFHTNSMPFEWLALSTPLKVLRQYTDDILKLEAILFGQAGLLWGDPSFDTYREVLYYEYRILQLKHKLEPIERGAWKFSRMRPNNSPYLRIAQLASLIEHLGKILSMILSGRSAESHRFFEVSASAYWDHHFRFGRKSSFCKKQLGKVAIERLYADAVIPLLKVYGEKHGIRDKEMTIVEL